MEIYRMRNPVGRPRKYKPVELWEMACNYFEWCDSHPWTKYEAIKSGADAGKLIEMPLRIPYTIEGLCFFCGVEENFLRSNKENNGDYSTVIKEIYKVIENQQFTGASVGAFNSNIIARKLGLVEKTTISTPEGEEIKVNAVTEHKVIFENYDDTNV